MTRDEILDRHPITYWVQQRGGEFKRSGKELTTNICPLTTHKEGHQCVNLDKDLQIWYCNDCGQGGTVIDWLIFEKGISVKEAMEELGGLISPEPSNKEDDRQRPTPEVGRPLEANVEAGSHPQPKILKTYDYTDENGKVVYQVVRFEPKDFRQRKPKGTSWEYNLDGVTRVLFNLPNVLRSKTVFVTEGEKDAETLIELGYVATTNCGGSSAWLEAYADILKGKDIVVVPDNDTAGERLFKNIVASVKELANSVKRLNVPSEHKDVTDWITSIPEDKRKGLIQTTLEASLHVIDPLPLYTPAEMEELYRDFVIQLPKKTYSLSKFQPKFHNISKQLMPGELVMIMGDTGAGKTAVMQAISKSASPLPTLFFELELPLELMFQRQVQMEMNCYEEEVITDYQNSKESYAPRFAGMQHILTCPKSGITMDTIEKYIHRSELKFGAHPVMVMIDYMGLVRKDNAKSRYEAMANAAEQAKVIAKKTNTIVFMGSQVSRPSETKGMLQNIQLHHAKGAGELENSANLVIGLTRPETHKLKMHVLKNTRGPVGDVIDCDFDGAKMQITEAINI